MESAGLKEVRSQSASAIAIRVQAKKVAVGILELKKALGSIGLGIITEEMREYLKVRYLATVFLPLIC